MYPTGGNNQQGLGGAAPITKIREFFPETMLWQPSLITDEKGKADLTINFADSITTWRLTASAVSADGRLGTLQQPLKVFQPFFVDLNLPVALTRGDEVAVPVVVHNHLKQAQKVMLTLDDAPWFDRLDDAVKGVELAAGEVRSAHYRLRARKVGHHEIRVTARGGDAKRIATADKNIGLVVYDATDCRKPTIVAKVDVGSDLIHYMTLWRDPAKPDMHGIRV